MYENYIALGELATEAIEKEDIRFQLRHKLVSNILGKENTVNSLFSLSLELGLLNQVGVEAKPERQPLYAFFHPTFQEYFSAFYITSKSDLAKNSQTVDWLTSYMYEHHWREIFLLVSEMLEDSSLLLSTMSKGLRLLVKDNSRIQNLLYKIEQKNALSQTIYLDPKKNESSIGPSSKTQATIRSFYCVNRFNYALTNGGSEDRESISRSTQVILKALAPTFSLDKVFATALGFENNSDINPEICIDHILTILLTLALDLYDKLSKKPDFAYTGLLTRVLESYLDDFIQNEILSIGLSTDLIHELEALRNELKDIPTNCDVNCQEWWTSQGKSWGDRLQGALITHRDIGSHIDFTKEDFVLLEKYFRGSALLVECLEKAKDLTVQKKGEIESSILRAD